MIREVCEGVAQIGEPLILTTSDMLDLRNGLTNATSLSNTALVFR